MIVAPNKAPVGAGGRPAQQPQPSQKQQQGKPTAPEEPAEAAVIKDLLKTLGVRQYDPRVVELLMDLAYRSTSELLQDAEAIAVAAGGSGAQLTPQDLALAAAQQERRHPQQPPSLQELHALARLVNKQPLTGPNEKQHGIKLPPVADCLLAQNYQVKPRERPQVPPAPPQVQQPQRQHFAVRQQHTLKMGVPQQGWQPPPDAAGAGAQPFAPPAHQQQQQQQPMAAAAAAAAAGGGSFQQPTGMDLDVHQETF